MPTGDYLREIKAHTEPPREQGEVVSLSESVSLSRLAVYFLRLGTVGFGGPIALVGYMQEDLVEERRWVSTEDYLEGLAFSQLSPGPLAAQLANYLGWVHSGTLGATLIGIAFVLPSLLMVLALAAAYVHFGQLRWIQGLFYGIGAAVSAIIIRSAWKLVRKTLGRDYLLWVVFAVLTITTAWTESEALWLFILAGVFVMMIKAPPLFVSKTFTQSLVTAPVAFLGSSSATVASNGLTTVFLFFFKAGAFVFWEWSCYCALPLRWCCGWVSLANGTSIPRCYSRSDDYTWAGRHNRWFHWLLGGWASGRGRCNPRCVLTPYLLVVFCARYYRRFAKNRQFMAFVQGVTAAAVGAIAGAAIILSKRAVKDFPTIVVALVSLLVLMRFKKIPEPLIILGAGLVGLTVKSGW